MCWQPVITEKSPFLVVITATITPGRDMKDEREKQRDDEQEKANEDKRVKKADEREWVRKEKDSFSSRTLSPKSAAAWF